MRWDGRLLRDNVFLVAAVLLPLVVVGFFLLATAIPRWTVPPPQYDLLVKANSYTYPLPSMHVDYIATSTGVHAHVRPVPPNSYPHHMALFIADHASGRLREVPVRLPDGLKPDDQPRDIPVEGLTRFRIVTTPEAPDGYRFDTRSRRGPGLLGDIFGMRRYDLGLVLVNGGRVVALTPPPSRDHLSPVTPLGWLVPAEGR
jgi:hypothetical protein